MDKQYIKKVVQDILNREFPKQAEKRRIVEYHDRLNFACPYCGDSAKNISAKRGNLYLNSLMYVCFNCDKKTFFTKFCSDFSVAINPDVKMDLYNYLDNNLSYNDYVDDYLDSKFDKLIDLTELTTALNNKNELGITEFRPVQKYSAVDFYLNERMIGDNLRDNIYQAKYYYPNGMFEWIICLLNKSKDKVLGMQIRNLKKGKNRMFKIFNYENLIKLLDNKNIEEHEIMVYNKLSYFFNILNIDVDKPVTIFEGYIDSLFYPNSIGVVGVNTDMRMLENSGIDIQYFYDNDFAGYKKSIQKIKRGFKVFLWQKFFKEIIKDNKSNDPYRQYDRMNKVKDLNNLSSIVSNPFKNLHLNNYFSNDDLDKLYIPKYYKSQKVY